MSADPTPSPFDPSTFQNLVNDFYVSRRALGKLIDTPTPHKISNSIPIFQVASAAWVVCDYVLTLEQEIKFVWVRCHVLRSGMQVFNVDQLKPWGVAKALFLWTRYAGLSILLLSVASSIAPGPVPLVYAICEFIYYFGGWGGMVTMATVSTIMVLRIYAMYVGSKRVAITLGILLVLYVAAEGSIFHFASDAPWLPPVEYLSLNLNPCFTGTSMQLSMGLWIARLAMDSILLGFAGFKSVQQYRQGWSCGIVELLIRDNILAFICILCVQVLNLTLEAVARPQATLAGIGFAIATDVLVGTRLLLHTREATSYTDDTDSIQLSELGARPAIVLTDLSDISVADHVGNLPRLELISEEADEDAHAYDDFTPVEESGTAKALLFMKANELV
ncbi:hypothetical protein DACRYDRAFT_116697 [Dacryopinax primogenitus]|uniref:DUF6533 domain-containing protein n=1 Tax=Dacryopinax primogenitus (strain DJM 731) TaxID=1858805 RepID=M5G707_DACPD|nr:uncharacterized protein DACRYDRAFT_116697 [Dacryopinax primogenitus]EJU01597.1 hypothetical protein DACRYDRAFT_116697 [Dacryopinax primogenitus]